VERSEVDGGNPGTARLQPGSGGWRSRGYIPHFDRPNLVQHVTFHLADSLPAAVKALFDEELRGLATDQRSVERRKRMQEWIDAGHGTCVLQVPEVAEMVQASLLHFDGDRYHLFSWVVMPNHVHVLFETVEGWSLSKVVTSWKSYTGRRIASFRDRQSHAGQGESAHVGSEDGATGRRVWQREYWDRFIRYEGHFGAAVAYIEGNPVTAGLVERPADWQWSSARWREQRTA